jgi:hypothetical protein
MKRREFVKGAAMVPMIPATGALLFTPGCSESTPPDKAAKAADKASSGGGSGGGKLPDFADKMLTSDMEGLGPDGKPTGIKATFTGASQANAICLIPSGVKAH